MGREWDRFREDDPGTGRHRGEHAGAQGVVGVDKGDHPAGRAAVVYGGGERPTTSRCEGCGKRDQFRKPHGCPDGTGWRRELIDPHAAPPSMLAFQSWCREWARLALRALKPGGWLLAFGGTRTYHRMASGVEDAGFEVRDQLQWLYGSGFPKSLDVGKAIDAQAGAVREVVGPSPRHGGGIVGNGSSYELPPESHMLTAPATPDAERWQGWGTALKPAHEPIVVARKPLAGTVAANVLATGCGALNVDGCRVGTDDTLSFGSRAIGDGVKYSEQRPENQTPGEQNAAGRWPANVVLDPEAAAMLDEQTGELHAHGLSFGVQHSGRHGGLADQGPNPGRDPGERGFNDSGGASRFFYCAKASSAERNAGLDGFEAVLIPYPGGRRKCRTCGRWEERPPQDDFTPCRCAAPDWENVTTKAEHRNVHPTVKPVELMRWLVRLVTPPGGLVVDPFTGSGTTGCAAALEGFRFVGIERDAEYAAIARARIAWWSEHPAGMELVKRLEAEAERAERVAGGQEALF